MWFLIFLLMATPVFAQDASTAAVFDSNRNVIVETIQPAPTVHEYDLDTCNQELFLLIEQHNSIQNQVNQMLAQQEKIKNAMQQKDATCEAARNSGLKSKQEAEGFPPVPQTQ